nr:hypothetical protein [Tanacetum cinerariifolium]
MTKAINRGHCREIEAIQDVQVKVLSDRVVDLDAKLMRMALHLDEEFFHLYLTTIAGQRWIFSHRLRLVVIKCLQSLDYLAALGWVIGRAIDKGIQDGLAAGIDHGKAGRVLAEVATYDPSAEANYVAVVNALRPAVKAPEAEHLQPLPDQLMLPIHRLEDQPLSAENLIGETSTSSVPAAVANTTASSTTFAEIGSVPPIPHAKAPPSSIVFEKEELDTTPERTSAPQAYIYFRIL